MYNLLNILLYLFLVYIYTSNKHWESSKTNWRLDSTIRLTQYVNQ